LAEEGRVADDEYDGLLRVRNLRKTYPIQAIK